MPRTKITKNSKRNREAASREEKVRNYEMKMDAMLTNIDELGDDYISQIGNQVQLMISKMNTKLLKMNFGDFLDLDLKHFSDFKAADQSQHQTMSSPSFCNTTAASTLNPKDVNRNDEGYLTEDSSTGTQTSSASAALLPHLQPLRSTRAMRTPGPLHSARALRGRRSRSACGGTDLLKTGSAKPQTVMKPLMNATSEHASRSKMRTPMASRAKAFSADRTPKPLGLAQHTNSPTTPPMALLRWPKPGEVALSKCGTPIVAQAVPDKFANVNIPTKNGVLLLRPKKLNELGTEFIEAIDSETLHQIKTLHENLNKIVNMADKVAQLNMK